MITKKAWTCRSLRQKKRAGVDQQFAKCTAKARSARARNRLEDSTTCIGEPGQVANRCITPTSCALDRAFHVVRNAANGEKTKRNAQPDDTVDAPLGFSVISVGTIVSSGSV